MDIDRLFANKEFLEEEINFFINKKHIKIIQENKELVQSHIKKARHNIEFYKLNNKNSPLGAICGLKSAVFAHLA